MFSFVFLYFVVLYFCLFLSFCLFVFLSFCPDVILIKCLKGLKSQSHSLCPNSKVTVTQWVSDWPRSGIELPGQLKTNEICSEMFCGNAISPHDVCGWRCFHHTTLSLVFSCPGSSIRDLGQWATGSLPLLNFDTKTTNNNKKDNDDKDNNNIDNDNEHNDNSTTTTNTMTTETMTTKTTTTKTMTTKTKTTTTKKTTMKTTTITTRTRTMTARTATTTGLLMAQKSHIWPF